MNTPRRLCGTMPPTHVSHPPTSFMTMWFSRRITRGSQLQSRHLGIGSIFSSKYGYARANMPVTFARAHDRLMCSNYARLHASKYDGPMRSLPFMCSCCTETGPFRAISDRSRGAGVESPLAYLRRRRVLCTLPILQPCALRHALHCYGCVRSGLREAICLALGTHGTKTNSRKGVRQHRRGCTWRLRS